MNKILGYMPREEYVKVEGLSQSDLSQMLKSPKHFKWRDRLWRDTEATRFGTALHTAVLEPQTFKDRYVIEPEAMPDGQEINRRVKAHRDYLTNWSKTQIEQGKRCVKPSEFDSIVGMLTSAAEHPTVSELMSKSLGGVYECVATGEMCGMKIKGQADFVVKHPYLGKVVVDVKTTQDASPAAFSRAIVNFRYDLQAGFYTHLFGADEFIFIVIEKNAPYSIGCYKADPSIIACGQELAERALNRVKECEANDSWPSYTAELGNILLPSWFVGRDQESASEM